MTPILILYIDSDFIYPVVASDRGAYERYEHPDRSLRDFRLWLYFEQDLASGRVAWSKRARAGYFSGNPSCQGDVFAMFGTPKKAHAVKMLADSGLVSALKAMYSAGGQRSETDIPTAYVFAGNIPEAARKDFIEYMQARSFATLSYTVSLENLAAAVLAPNAKFGDKLLTFASSGNDLVASNFIFDAPEYMLSDQPQIFKNLGYNPVREALVQYVVNKIESKQHFLVGEKELQSEIAYQKQFVDEWLRDIDLSDSLSTIAFRYNNRSNEYQVSIETDMLKNKLNEHVEHLLQEMNSYRNRAARSAESPINSVVLIGDMFDDEDFRTRVASSVGRGADVKYLATTDLAAVLAAYPALYPDLRQQLSEYERVARGIEDKVSDTEKFIANADKLREFAELAAALVMDYQRLVEDLRNKMDSALGAIDNLLVESNFNAAEEQLSRAHIPEADNPYFAREAALNRDIQLNRELFNNQNAKGIAEQINASMLEITNLHTEIEKQMHRADDLRAEIDRLRQAWPEYQRLMAEFEDADVSRKREIVEDIQRRRLTREPLPSTGLTMPFLAKIEASVSKSGGFLGFGAKKSLNVSVLTAEGYNTECKTVVLVQDRPLVDIKPANVRATIEAGFTGRRNLDPIALPLDGNSAAKRLYIYLKPALDQAIGINDSFMAVPSVEIDL